MYKLFFTFKLLLAGLSTVVAQSSMEGAWQLKQEDGKAVNNREMTVIFAEDYFMFGNHHEDGRFISAGGGMYEVNGNKINMTFDFFTDYSSIVRVPVSLALDLKENNFSIDGDVQGERITQSWERIDAEPDALNGAWRFATRVDEDGTMGERRELGPRQTIKILNGGRFQWAAFNYETKQFMGTGGGTYTAEDGKYTENIEFFSRDDERVGASLSFDFRREGDDWFHKGKSSKGDPMHEVWMILDR